MDEWIDSTVIRSPHGDTPMQPPLMPSPRPRSRPATLLLLWGTLGLGLWPGGVAQAQGIGRPGHTLQLVPKPRDRGAPTQTFGGGANLIPNPRDRGTPTYTRGGSPTGGTPEDAGIGPADLESAPVRPRLIGPVSPGPADLTPSPEPSPCRDLEPPFVNLSPDPDAPGGLMLEVVAANPTLHVHLPVERPAIAEWAIFDSSGTLLEVQQLPLPPEAEQVAFSAFTAASGQGLEPQKSYRWSLVLGCDAQDPSLNSGVLGELRRTAIAPPPHRPQGHPSAPSDRIIDTR
ncbi:MAG: hypothetical protein Fur0042_24760 [Cyanophyceae cyanobacterium]